MSYVLVGNVALFDGPETMYLVHVGVLNTLFTDESIPATGASVNRFLCSLLNLSFVFLASWST